MVVEEESLPSYEQAVAQKKMEEEGNLRDALPPSIILKQQEHQGHAQVKGKRGLPRRNKRPQSPRRERKPWFLLLVAFADIFCGGYCASKHTHGKFDIIMMHKDGQYWKPVFLEFLSLVNSIRILVQIIVGIGLAWGICSSNEAETANSIQMWIKTTYFIVAEQAISVFSIIARFFTEDMDDEAKQRNVDYLVVNTLDVLIRTLGIVILFWSVRPKYFCRRINTESSIA